MSNSLLDKLSAYESWVTTRRVLEECGALTQAQFEPSLGLGHGTMERTQALNMLRLLGNEKPLEWHPFEWDEARRVGEA